ncbi:MAG: EamA family transporter [Candidatus Micrarchaeaceae archaeon]
MNIYIVIFLTLIAAFIASIAQLLFKKSMTKKISKIGNFVELLKTKKVIYGLLLYFMSLIIYLYALKQAPLSIVYPTFASSFIFVAAVSYFHLKENFGLRRSIGIILIFIGIAIVGLTM